MAAKKESDISPAIIEKYKELIATLQEVEFKGVSLPYTSQNGNMFSFLDNKGKLSIRLSKAERELFLKKYENSISVQHGIIMKEYVLVPQSLFDDLKEIEHYFKMSYEYASTLKPKATKKSGK